MSFEKIAKFSACLVPDGLMRKTRINLEYNFPYSIVVPVVGDCSDRKTHIILSLADLQLS